MELFVQTFEAVAVLLLIGVLGFWIISRRVLPGHVLKFLSTLALEIALPCLVFVNIVRNFDPARHLGWWTMPLWWALFTACVGLLSIGAMVLARRGTRREFGISMFYQNATFFPLAIIAQVFGADSPHLTSLFLFTMFFAATVFTTYRLWFGGSLKLSDWRKVLHPVFVATVLALATRLGGVNGYVPGFVLSGLDMVGRMTVPLLMLILGGNIYLDFQAGGRPRVLEVVKFVALKNVLFPLVALGVLAAVRPSYGVAMILLLESAVPPITSVPILVQREGGDRRTVSHYLVASFLCSLVTIPLAFWAFGLWFPRP